MKVLLPLLLILIISCSGGAGAVTVYPAGDFPYAIHEKVLANGLRVMAVPFDSPGLVTYSTVVQAGSRDEVEKGVTGFAHFFEHVMFYGSKKYPKSEIKKINKSLAAGGNANTTNDRTYYYLTGNAAKLESFFQVASDNFKNLNFTEAEFKKEAGAVLGEYTKNFSGWFRQLDSKMREIAFTKHTYGHTTMGYEADIKDMPNQFDYAWEFYDRFYKPEHCALIIVGDVDPSNVFTLAEKYYGDWKRGNYTPAIPTEEAQKEERSGHIERGDVLPAMMLAYKTPDFTSNLKETIALETIGTLLSSNKSDLYQRLVFKEQKAKSFWAWQTSENKDPQAFRVVFRVDRGKESDLDYLKMQFEAEMEKIKTEPIDAAFLADIKSNSKYAMLGGLNNPQSIASTLASYYQKTSNPNAVGDYLAALNALTKEDIMAAANKYFNSESRTIVTMFNSAKGTK
jgi:zinc protease